MERPAETIRQPRDRIKGQPQERSGMEARQGGDSFGSVHDRSAPKGDAMPEAQWVRPYVLFLVQGFRVSTLAG